MLSRVEANRSSLRLDGLVNAAKELDVSTDYLLGLTDDPRPTPELLEQVNQMQAQQERTERALIESELTGPRELEYAAVVQRVYELSGSLGMPTLSSQVGTVTMPDDSMEPNIQKGDALVAELDVDDKREGRIYAVRLGEELLVRRATLDFAGGWRLISDNPDWEPVIWPAYAVIVGEVVWAARSLSRATR